MNRTFSLFPNFRLFLHDIINPRLFLNASFAAKISRFVVFRPCCFANIANLCPGVPIHPPRFLPLFEAFTQRKTGSPEGLPVSILMQYMRLRGVTYLARALSASAISWKIPWCFLAMIALMTSRVATIRTIAMSRLMTTFWIRPARMKLTKATPATVSA